MCRYSLFQPAKAMVLLSRWSAEKWIRDLTFSRFLIMAMGY